MILVTGGTGLVGSHLLFNLVSKGETVRALKRANSDLELVKNVFSFYASNQNQLFNSIEWVNGDVFDVYALEEALQKVRDVYHCAGLISFNRKDKKKLIETNVHGTRNLVNASLNAQIRKFCMFSSIAALGTSPKGETEINETTQWNVEQNKSAYSSSKFRAELEVWRGIAEGLHAIIVNPSVILGPGGWHKGSSLLFKTIAEGLNFYTKGITGYVDVRDVCCAAIELMESEIKNERFILNGENCSFEWILKSIAKELRVKIPSKYASPKITEMAWRLTCLKNLFSRKKVNFTKETARSAHQVNYYSNQKIKNELAFQFTDIEKSIRDTAKHYPLNTKTLINPV